MRGLENGLAFLSESLPRLVGFRTHGAVTEGVGEGDAHALLIEHDGGGVELDVGRLEPVAGAEEAAGLADVRGQRPAAFALQEADVLGAERGHQASRCR